MLIPRSLLSTAACITFSLILISAGLQADTTLTAYDCWSNLGFEGQVNMSQWSSNGTAVTYTNDSSQAHTGTSALHIDGTAPVSIWGGPAAGSIYPAAGDSIGGSFWIKILATPTTTTMVDVRMTGYDSNNAETIYCQTTSVDVSTLPLNTWVQINCVPTSATLTTGMSLGFNIVSSGGINCLIDDITFGKLITTIASSANAGIPPLFQEYVGSTFNGNFEVGTATTGNQYWGQYIPNQSAVSGSPNMMNLITSPAGTEPGATVNGANMVSITRGGAAWNIGALSQSASDKLPHIGDAVGGSYWIYVPASADLTKGAPTVYFVSQTAGGDVTVADSSAFPATSLQKGKWNLVPISPVTANNTIVSNATGTAIMVSAPQLNTTTNPLYSAPFYIDNIRVGKIPTGVYLSKYSSLIDAGGNPITALGSSDTTLRATVSMQNSQNSTATSGWLILKLYQQGVLKSTARKAITLPAKGASGISLASTTLSVPLDGLDKTKLSAKLFLYDSSRQNTLADPFTLIQPTQRIAPNDSHIQYVGRWSGSASAYQSDWIRPYLKLTFTGSTLKINLTQSVNLSVVLDGVETQYSGANGLVELGSNLSPLGTHTVRIAGLTYPDLIKFDGLYIDDTATLANPIVNTNEIEFIGDSITAWNNGYSWLVPETLGVESSRIAWPGIALVDGFGYYQTTPPLYGMQSAYLKIAMPDHGSGATGNWSFSASPYSPNIVVINLGTNDGAAITGNTTLISNFQTAYTNFIQNVRSKFPSADIFVLRAFSIHYADVNTAATNAVQSVITAGDTKVHYVDTSTWSVTIGSDGIHPTDAGHVAITNYLAPILKSYLRTAAPSFINANSVTFNSGATNNFIIQANGWPAATFSSTSLPSGLTLNSASGLLSGIPTATGAYPITLTAYNTTGSSSQAFTLTISPGNTSSSRTLTNSFPAGTGTVVANTVFSLPLTTIATAAGQMTGLITGVTANTITNTNAGWTSGQLSTVSTPYLIRFTSGAALGHTFLLSTSTANTATTVTLDASEKDDLTALGILAGDGYEIVSCPTLLHALGTPTTTGVLGGTAYTSADQIQIVLGGVWKKYYYNTSQNRWQLAGLETAANNVPLPPYASLLYGRLATTPLTLTFSGYAPDLRRHLDIAKTGLTFLSSGWNTDTTLSASGLSSLSGWVANTNPANADTVSLWSGSAWKKYYFDGTNWRLVGLNTVADSVVIRTGTGLLISRINSVTGTASLIQNLP